MDLVNQVIANTEKEWIKHDEIMNWLRGKRGTWPEDYWEDAQYLGENWPDDQRWLMPNAIWKRNGDALALGTTHLNVQGWTVGTCDKIVNGKVKAKSVDKEIVAWAMEDFLIKNSEPTDMMKEGILHTTCFLKRWDFSEDGKKVELDLDLMIRFPSYLGYKAEQIWHKRVLKMMKANQTPDDIDKQLQEVPEPGEAWPSDKLIKTKLIELYHLIKRTRTEELGNRKSSKEWVPGWTVVQWPWPGRGSHRWNLDSKGCQLQQVARRKNHLYRAWSRDPPPHMWEWRKHSRIKEIDQWINHYVADLERLKVAKMGVEPTDFEKTQLYLLEEEKTQNWVAAMQSLKQHTLEEEAKEDYPNLMTVVADVMRPKDRVIVAQIEKARKALREKEEEKKIWQKVMSNSSR